MSQKTDPLNKQKSEINLQTQYEEKINQQNQELEKERNRYLLLQEEFLKLQKKFDGGKNKKSPDTELGQQLLFDDTKKEPPGKSKQKQHTQKIDNSTDNLDTQIDKDKIEKFDENNQSRGFYSIKNRLNDLTGKEWVYWSKSVINKPYPPNCQHKLRSQHGGQKPPDLCADIIKVFTKENQLVLDPFAGVGGTLLGASLCGRNSVGIELNQNYIDVYEKVCQLENIKKQRVLCGDSKEVLQTLHHEALECDFMLTDVPYWNMDSAKKSKGKFKKVGEDQKERRQSKLKEFNDKNQTKEEWLGELKAIFEASLKILKKNSYLAVFIGDMYNSGEYHFLTSDLAAALLELKLTMKANIVWYDVSKSLHVYGYLYQYIPSMIHQNILIFRKEF